MPFGEKLVALKYLNIDAGSAKPRLLLSASAACEARDFHRTERAGASAPIWFAHQDGRVEQHPDRDEEEDSEGVAERQRLFGRPVAELGFGKHHAGDERAEREGDAEQLCEPRPGRCRS
jgi:hypothetical protein